MNDKFKKLLHKEESDDEGVVIDTLSVDTPQPVATANTQEEIELSREDHGYDMEATVKLQENADKAANVSALQVSGGNSTPIGNVTQASTFTEAIDKAKVEVVKEAAATDEKFVGDFKGKLKEATLKLAEVERDKAKLEQQNIEFHSELLSTQQELNEHIQSENKWKNRERRRQYHFNGVKPIMNFVGINEPMNLIILYFMTAALIPFYLLNKFLKGTIGAIIAGADNENRPAKVRAFLWTMIAVIFAGAIALAVYLVLTWIGVVPNHNII